MESLLPFINAHPYLVAAALALVVLYWFIAQQLAGAKINPQMVGSMVHSHKARIIDIREPSDFSKGYISGSENIPFSQLKNHVDTLKNHPTPLIFVCKMGHNASAAIQLVQHTNSFRLDGGVYAWQSNGLPLIKTK